MTGLTPDVIRAFATARRWADLNRGLDVSERQLWQLAHMLAEAEPRARDREVRQRGPRRSGLRPGAGWGGKAAARPPDGLKPGPGSTGPPGPPAASWGPLRALRRERQVRRRPQEAREAGRERRQTAEQGHPAPPVQPTRQRPSEGRLRRFDPRGATDGP